MMSINEPAKPLTITFTTSICLRHVCGSETVNVTASQLADYNRDPDGFAGSRSRARVCAPRIGKVM